MSKFSYLMVLFPIFQFVAFMQHCPTEGVKRSIFQRSSYFEFAHIYSKNSIEGNYLFKVNDTITKTRSVICSKFTIETPKYCFSVLIVNFQQISHFLFMFLFVQFEQVTGMPLFQIQLSITIDGEINKNNCCLYVNIIPYCIFCSKYYYIH